MRAPPEPSRDRRTPLWRGLQALCRVCTSVAFDLKVEGVGHVPSDGPVLLLSNHQSYLDPVLLGVQLRRPVCYLAKSELFANPAFGWLIRALNAFPIGRGTSDVGAMKEALRRLEEGRVLNVYPEGSRSRDGEIGPVLPGVALLIRRSGVPVVPAVIDGSFDAWPRWRTLPCPRPVRVRFGPRMRLDGLEARQIVASVDATLRSMLRDLRATRPREARSDHERRPAG